MKFLKIMLVAFKNIISNKLRSILTMLGLIIGVSSVIILVGIGNGSSSEILSQVKQLGTDILTINITDKEKALEYKNLFEISNLQKIESITSYKDIGGKISKGKNVIKNSSIIATDENYLDIRDIKLEKGRNLSIIDIENKSRVCIIGYEINKKIFGSQDSIGNTLKIEGNEFIIIGILEKQESSMGTNVDNTLLIPISTAKLLSGDNKIKNAYVRVDNEQNIDSVMGTLQNYLMTKLQITKDNYKISSEAKSLEAMKNINNTFSMLLAGIASISLIVGGIGVMNVMLVSVTERTREIGIRKALGAKKSDILFQFLVESLVLSLIGGILGVIIGLILGNFAYLLDYTFEYSNTIIIISFVTSMLIGIIFGIFPAYKAAKLNPINALRQE